MKFQNTLTDANRKAFAINPSNTDRLTHFGDTPFEYNSLRKAIIACTMYRPSLGNRIHEGNFTLTIRQNANHKYEIGQTSKRGKLVYNISFVPKHIKGSIVEYAVKVKPAGSRTWVSPEDVYDMPNAPKKELPLVASSGKIGTLVLNGNLADSINDRRLNTKLAKVFAEIIVDSMFFPKGTALQMP